MSAQRIAYILDRYPVLSETFVTSELECVRSGGLEVVLEVEARPDGDPGDGVDGLQVHYRSDDRTQMRDLAWLLAHRPVACGRDLLGRRRWRREEWARPLRDLAPAARRLHAAGVAHLHAHFAGAAALDALRLGALLGRPYSVTAHAYDIFLRPRNLAEKLRRAAFAMTVCAYNERHLRTVAPGADLHTMVMGVDGDAFRRTRPYPGGRTVVAVGRLVEKKGFGDLIAAAAHLRERAPLERVVIVGDGPLRPELARLIADLGLDGVVELAGPRSPAQIRALLDEADLLAMPCVVASDGDRDSMPVVVKEALAMEIPVVGSDEVGVPEMIRDGWGRLVPPGDAGALAQEIDAVLSLPAPERAAMGAAGRAFVLEHCAVATETRRLTALFARGAGRPRA